MSTPAGRGFVKVATPLAYDLIPNSGVAGADNAYMVSLYHQLHCLMNLQAMHVDLLSNGSRAVVDADHAQHCFSYIRQGIMCAGDMTLEAPDPNPVPGRNPLQGWETKHSCRKWEDLTKWIRENAAV